MICQTVTKKGLLNIIVVDGGFGPLRDAEEVIFAVFETTERDGFKLTSNSFDNGYLKDNCLSLVRGGCVTLPEFDTKAVGVGASKKGPFVGIARARVAKVRGLKAKIESNPGIAGVRALCLLDVVEKSDVGGHATAGYCDGVTMMVSQSGFGGARAGRELSKVRVKIRLDLVH